MNNILNGLIAFALTSPFAAAPASALQGAPSAGAVVQASSTQASAALTQRAEDLVKMINGEIQPSKVFSPRLLDQIPAERLLELSGKVRAAYGRAVSVERIETTTANSGTVFINFEKSQLPLKLTIEAEGAQLANGLQF